MVWACMHDNLIPFLMENSAHVWTSCLAAVHCSAMQQLELSHETHHIFLHAAVWYSVPLPKGQNVQAVGPPSSDGKQLYLLNVCLPTAS